MSAPLILGTNSIKDVGYNVDNSLRFDDGSSDYLSRTPSSASGRRTFTFSFWIKRGVISSVQTPFSAGNSATEQIMRFESGDTFYILDYQSAVKIEIRTSRVFRDPSAWFHIVVAVDTTQATASDRVKIYVNGVQETSFGTETYPAQNTDLMWNSNVLHAIGRKESGDNEYLDGYLAEVVNIDGSQLDPTSFGEFDEDSGIWKPIDVSGLTFGTNGFYLDFEDSSALGNDVSGNNNDFTVNNLTSIDQTTDTCTNNYATYNSLANFYPADTFSNGNLTQTTSSSNYSYGVSNIGISTGKWYCEIKNSTSNTNTIGIADRESHGTSDELTTTTYGYAYYFGGQIYNNGSQIATYSSYTTGDIIGIALDLDNNKLYFSKNGTWQGSSDPSTNTGGISITAPSSNRTGFYFFASGEGNGAGSAVNEANFGNPPYSANGYSDANGYGNMSYSVPSGYYILNTKNLAEYG